MPLHIIRQDITKLKCDAIVNAANSTLLGGGGVDGAIHNAAGEGLYQECKTLGGCETGEAKITKGYNLPCKYVIHTVGPIYNDGKHGEKELLESCYKKSLAIAKEYGCETVAFPLISSGAYGYPKDKALSVAVNEISKFLFENDMTVYIVVFDKDSFCISEKLFDNVQEYIDDNYVDRSARRYRREADECYYNISSPRHQIDEVEYKISRDIAPPVCACIDFPCEELTDIERLLENIDDNFAVTLLKLIDIKGMTDVECYKKANVSKQTWYKIMNEKGYRPSKNTVICFAIALSLSLDECKKLLETVGFALSKSIKFDIIIEYFFLHKIYDIFKINETLFAFDQPCLGV